MTLRAGTRQALLALALVAVTGHAGVDPVKMTIHGVLVEPPCTVTTPDGAARTEVAFGMVQLTEINTTQAEQPLTVKVVCEGPSPGSMGLKLRVTPGATGTLTVAGKKVLKTTRPGLGIDLTMAGNTVTPDVWVAVNGVDTTVPLPAGEVVLQARLVADNPATPGTGDFSATANLTMAYQ